MRPDEPMPRPRHGTLTRPQGDIFCICHMYKICVRLYAVELVQ
jgi:hypothetical protein